MFPTGTVPCASHLPSIELYIAGKFSDFSQLKKKIEMRKKYLHKSVDHYWKAKAQNPMRYTY